MGSKPGNGFIAILPSQEMHHQLRKGRADFTPLPLVRPLSGRSGCVPAEPYPPLRSVGVYPMWAHCDTLAGAARRKKTLTVSRAFIYGAGSYPASRFVTGSC